jgi:hypothetical protein
MIERRYVGVQTGGRTALVLEKIRQAVRACNQTHAIPIIKVEKKARGQFYIFLAIEGVEGSRLPDTIVNVLRRAGLTSRQYWPLTLSEIKFMVSTAEIETIGFSALSYKPLWDRDVGDPYDLSDDMASETEAADPQLGEKYNQLLYWLSATAEGTWGAFVRTCGALGLADDSKYARRILRRLMLLGHIECSKEGSAWTISPPAMVICPSKSGIGFLCGQRTPKMLRILEGMWTLAAYPQPDYQGPSRIEVRCETLAERVLELPSGIALHMTGTASTRLAELLLDLEGWKETLTPIEKLNTTNCSVERWDGRQYAPCPEFYQRGDEYFGASGLYRLTRETNSYRMVLYFDCDRQRWLKGDWYGLRFLVYRDAGQDCEAIYRAGTNELMIPAEERWPLLYERALVLATGQLPRFVDNQNWRRYEGVSGELVQQLTSKLSVSIKEVID